MRKASGKADRAFIKNTSKVEKEERRVRKHVTTRGPGRFPEITNPVEVMQDSSRQLPSTNRVVDRIVEVPAETEERIIHHVVIVKQERLIEVAKPESSQNFIN